MVHRGRQPHRRFYPGPDAVGVLGSGGGVVPRGAGIIARFAEWIDVDDDTPRITIGEGGTPLVFARRLSRELVPARAAVLFHYSLAYLALLFVAMAVDPLIA